MKNNAMKNKKTGRKKKLMPAVLLLIPITAAILFTRQINHTYGQFQEAASSLSPGIPEHQILESEDYALHIRWLSYEYAAAFDSVSADSWLSDARYYLEYEFENRSGTDLPRQKPLLEYLVNGEWYSASTEPDGMSAGRSTEALSPIRLTDLRRLADSWSETQADTVSAGSGFHGLISIGHVNGFVQTGEPVYTGAFWPGPYRLLYPVAADRYISLEFDLEESSFERVTQFLEDSWNSRYNKTDQSDITPDQLLLPRQNSTGLCGIAYRENIYVDRLSSLCWEQEYRKPSRCYTITVRMDSPGGASLSQQSALLEYQMSDGWYRLNPEDSSSLNPEEMKVEDSLYRFTLYPVLNHSTTPSPNTGKFRMGSYRILFPVEGGKWIPLEFELE